MLVQVFKAIALHYILYFPKCMRTIYCTEPKQFTGPSISPYANASTFSSNSIFVLYRSSRAQKVTITIVTTIKLKIRILFSHSIIHLYISYLKKYVGKINGQSFTNLIFHRTSSDKRIFLRFIRHYPYVYSLSLSGARSMKWPILS